MDHAGGCCAIVHFRLAIDPRRSAPCAKVTKSSATSPRAEYPVHQAMFARLGMLASGAAAGFLASGSSNRLVLGRRDVQQINPLEVFLELIPFTDMKVGHGRGGLVSSRKRPGADDLGVLRHFRKSYGHPDSGHGKDRDGHHD